MATLVVGLVACDDGLEVEERERDPETKEPAFDPSDLDPAVPVNPEPEPEPEPEPDALTSGFITDPDGGGIEDDECDLYAQNCGVGEKCNVWANDGGSAWNATKCVPIDTDPDLAGQTCHVEGSGVSGIDSCEGGAFCWDVDLEGTGMCVPYCQGSENNPTCDNPRENPAAGKEFCICLPMCDPILNDCPAGCGCYATDTRFQCVPDASGPDMGVFGDPCEFTNACDPGLSCTSAEFVECEDSRCCTYFCSIENEDTCPGEHQCRSIYEEGEAPPGLEDVGLCLLAES